MAIDRYLSDGVTPNPEYNPSDTITEASLTPSPVGKDVSNITATSQYNVPDPVKPSALGDYGSIINAPAPATDYAGKVGALGSTLNVGEKSRYISPEATVQGQLDLILNKDADYMKLGEARAKAEAERKGLLSSTMAIGASRKASIETALPIAQQDAETYRMSELAQQQGISTSALQSQKTEEDKSLTLQQYGQEGALSQQKAYQNLEGLRYQGKINYEVEKLGQSATDRRTQLDLEYKSWLQDQNISADTRKTYMQQSTELSLRHAADLTTIITSKDFAYMEDRVAAIEFLNNGYKSDIEFLSSSAGVAMTWGGVTTYDPPSARQPEGPFHSFQIGSDNQGTTDSLTPTTGVGTGGIVDQPNNDSTTYLEGTNIYNSPFNLQG